jgi:hypothetical protein
MPAVDTLITVSKGAALLTLTCEKQKDAAPFAPIAVRLVPCLNSLVAEFAPERAADDRPLSANARSALAALEDVGPEGVTTSQWLELCAPIARRTFYRAKQELESMGQVANVNVGTDKRPRWQPNGARCQ